MKNLIDGLPNQEYYGTIQMKMHIGLYQERLNLKNATFTRIDHEDAMVAIVYKVTFDSDPPLILKICTRTNDYLHEVYFLNHFAGIIPVPRIVQVVPPEEGIKGAILMECHTRHAASNSRVYRCTRL